MRWKKPVKYIHCASPFFIHIKKHFCPVCGTRVALAHKQITVNSHSPEATHYDFSVGDTFFDGDVEFRIGYFNCPKCKLEISFQGMKDYENNKS